MVIMIHTRRINMAGIGFELKKLFKKKGVLPGLRACFFSTLITVGPTLFCILMLTILQYFFQTIEIDLEKREVFMSIIIYSFIFSLMLTSGLTMLLSRYVSDKIYKMEEVDILPSLNGAITVYMFLGGILGFTFYYRSPLNLAYKIVAYILFMELNILWIQTVYISALRKYTKIVKGFFMGIFIGILLVFILVGQLKIEAVIGALVSIDIGFFIILLFFFSNIQGAFRKNKGNCFTFLTYLDKYPSLFFISFIYTLGLYIHNFIFWKGKYQIITDETYVFAPIYDVPAFWAFLSIIPAMVIFAVSFETSFYEKYKKFYDNIINDGIKEDINKSKNEMQIVLFEQLRHVMGIQLVFSGLFLVVGRIFLPLAGLTNLAIRIFNVLVIGDYAFVIMFIILSILLYFDDRKGALLVVCIFTVLNGLLTELTILMGETYYGLGFMAGAFIALIFGFLRLSYFCKNIDYYTFCSPPIIYIENEKTFTKISRNIDKMLENQET